MGRDTTTAPDAAIQQAEQADLAGADGERDALLAALRRLMRPLIRLLVAKQIPYPAFSALLKSVYVDVAERDFALDAKRQTDSRVSLLSGVHRKDVARLRGGAVDPPAPRSVALGAQIVARWLADPALAGPDGSALPLPRQASSPGGPSFDGLVSSLSKDIRARAVLDELVRVGVVSVDDRGRVCLEASAFVPTAGFAEKAFYLGRNVSDHIAAAAGNVLGEESPRFERSVYYARLCPASISDLEAVVEREGMAALRAVNRRALELQRRDAGLSDAKRRMSFGAYFYDAEVAGNSAPDDVSPQPGGDDV